MQKPTKEQIERDKKIICGVIDHLTMVIENSPWTDTDDLARLDDMRYELEEKALKELEG